MKGHEAIAQDILRWARAHDWYGKQTATLRPAHIHYLGILISRMDDLSEASMNRAWASLRSVERPSSSDSKARLVCELIAAYCNAIARKNPD